MVSCNFSPLRAYTDREIACKGGVQMKREELHGIGGGDVDDLIFQDSWLASER